MPTAMTIASRRWADNRMAHGSRSESFIRLHAFKQGARTADPLLRGRHGSLTVAKLPIISVICKSPCLDPMDVAVLDPHAVAHPQVEVALSSTISELPESSRTVMRYRVACACFFSISFPTTAPPIAPAMVAAVFPRPLPIWWPITPPAMPPITVPPLTGLLSGAR